MKATCRGSKLKICDLCPYGKELGNADRLFLYVWLRSSTIWVREAALSQNITWITAREEQGIKVVIVDYAKRQFEIVDILPHMRNFGSKNNQQFPALGFKIYCSQLTWVYLLYTVFYRYLGRVGFGMIKSFLPGSMIGGMAAFLALPGWNMLSYLMHFQPFIFLQAVMLDN